MSNINTENNSIEEIANIIWKSKIFLIVIFCLSILGGYYYSSKSEIKKEYVLKVPFSVSLVSIKDFEDTYPETIFFQQNPLAFVFKSNVNNFDRNINLLKSVNEELTQRYYEKLNEKNNEIIELNKSIIKELTIENLPPKIFNSNNLSRFYLDAFILLKEAEFNIKKNKQLEKTHKAIIFYKPIEIVNTSKTASSVYYIIFIILGFVISIIYLMFKLNQKKIKQFFVNIRS